MRNSILEVSQEGKVVIKCRRKSSWSFDYKKVPRILREASGTNDHTTSSLSVTPSVKLNKLVQRHENSPPSENQWFMVSGMKPNVHLHTWSSCLIGLLRSLFSVVEFRWCSQTWFAWNTMRTVEIDSIQRATGPFITLMRCGEVNLCSYSSSSLMPHSCCGENDNAVGNTPFCCLCWGVSASGRLCTALI